MTDMILRIKSADLFRMIGWLLAGLALYGASIAVGADYPQPQVILQKLGNVTVFSYVGYWISRQALGRIDEQYRMPTDPGRVIARAVVIGAAILAGALGL